MKTLEKISNLDLLRILQTDFQICETTKDEDIIDNLQYKDIEILKILLDRLRDE